MFYLLTVLAAMSLFLFATFMSIIEAPKPHTDMKRIADIRMLNIALEMYHGEYKKYPDTLEELTNKGILTNLPKDPILKEAYEYRPSSDKTSFMLKTILDNRSHNSLKDDIDGKRFGLDCDDPAYCVMPAP